MRFLLAVGLLALSTVAVAANNYIEVNFLPASITPTKEFQVVNVTVSGTLTFAGCTHAPEYGRVLFIASSSGPGFVYLSAPTLNGGALFPLRDGVATVVCTGDGWYLR